jgi:hypothetical protein
MTLSKMPPLERRRRYIRNEVAVGRHAWLLMTRIRGFEVATRASSFLWRKAPIRSAALEGDRRCCDGFEASGCLIRNPSRDARRSHWSLANTKISGEPPF